MSARINYGDRHQTNSAENAAVATSAPERECPCCDPQNGCHRPCSRCVEFCETVTLHEMFTANISPSSTRIAYDTSFLGYTVEEETVHAKLPCGGSCPVTVYKVSLTGAIPYIINCGTVTSGCGSPCLLSIQGSVMVDEPVGYACDEPDLTELSCSNVTPHVEVLSEQCGCSEKTNITCCGTFTFSNLPALM